MRKNRIILLVIVGVALAIVAMKAALANLTGLDQSLTGQFARFRSREQITLLPFSTEVVDVGQFGVSSTTARGEDMQRIRDYVDQLQTGGNTAIYSALAEAYSQAQAARRRIPTGSTRSC